MSCDPAAHVLSNISNDLKLDTVQLESLTK